MSLQMKCDKLPNETCRWYVCMYVRSWTQGLLFCPEAKILWCHWHLSLRWIENPCYITHVWCIISYHDFPATACLQLTGHVSLQFISTQWMQSLAVRCWYLLEIYCLASVALNALPYRSIYDSDVYWLRAGTVVKKYPLRHKLRNFPC
jgi:hypothetical protein